MEKKSLKYTIDHKLSIKILQEKHTTTRSFNWYLFYVYLQYPDDNCYQTHFIYNSGKRTSYDYT